MGNENEEAKSNEEKEEVKEAAMGPEPEAKTMTLEEYRKQKKSIHRNPNAKKEEKEASEKKQDKKPAAKPAAGKKVPVGFHGHQRQQREGDDRRGGDRRDNRRENRGARGDNNNAKKKTNAEFNLADDFPTLG